MPRRKDKLWNELSDESSFYGNDEEVALLEERVRNSALDSSSSKPTRKSKPQSKSKRAMSSSDSDAEAFAPLRQQPPRNQGKRMGKNFSFKAKKEAPKRTHRPNDPESTDASESSPEPAKILAGKKTEVEDPESTASDSSAPEPARISTRKKIKTEDPESTDSDSSAPEPKTSSTKKRKADSSESVASDATTPPKKKTTVKRESPESTESGTPSSSPLREQPPDEVREPEAKQEDESTEGTDESTESPDESDSNEDNDQQLQPQFDLAIDIPPSIANMDDSAYWIRVKNPHYRGAKEPNPAVFWATAMMDFLGAPLERRGGRGSAKINPEGRRILESGILQLARREGIMSGKWLFFLTPDRVDYYWNVIARATERGELGPEAKVATDDGSGKARMLAVYTYNFDDVADVRRVALKLVNLGLIKPYDRPIYYKTDAYTYLDITYNNEWGLKASLYNSRDILAGRV